jgi:hypothetical protein
LICSLFVSWHIFIFCSLFVHFYIHIFLTYIHNLMAVAEPKDLVYLLNNCPHHWLFLHVDSCRD